MKTLKTIIVTLIILAAFGIVGEMDYQDQKQAEATQSIQVTTK